MKGSLEMPRKGKTLPLEDPAYFPEDREASAVPTVFPLLKNDVFLLYPHTLTCPYDILPFSPFLLSNFL
jgi:hypothetical protein